MECSNSALARYAREAPFRPLTDIHRVETQPPKLFKDEFMDITFREADVRWVHHPHNDVLVISIQIGTKNIHRAFIDNGSSANILYYKTFKKMGLPNRDMSGEDSWVYGFSGAGVRVMGSIRLPCTLGESPLSVTKMLEFKVLNQESSHNALLGWPFLWEMRVITSIHHLTIKFPTPNGMGCIKGSQSSNTNANEKIGPAEDTIEIPIDEKDPSRVLRIGSQLAPRLKEGLSIFLLANLNVFAWNHSNMVGIDPEVICHHFNIDPNHKGVRQKQRAVSGERAITLAEEVDRLLDVGLIRESFYPDWLENPVLVRKPNSKWRTYVDFTDLNKACPKDSFSFPRIDQLVDAKEGHALLSFMDAYSRYNQILMYGPDQEHTSFITDRGLYCYIGMPFSMINTGATYQRLVNKMFNRHIGKTMEVYVDVMLVKCKKAKDHIANLDEMFHILRKYRMKLNPKKCVFVVESRKFLGFMVNHRGIEANPVKIKALLDMKSLPASSKCKV
ncbi:uncharacterized protein LOC141691055 [Apium graveolens]|uniref:uncharacterized protein LOC141691055 n=1 Tax=Apium graveolens TaxID=4045 RepID=UPI003D7A6578